MTDELKSIARQVWQEFSPRDGEELAFRYDGGIMVTVSDSTEGFDIDPDQPAGEFASHLADRIQTIVMEERQQMVPDCPLHPTAHPLQSDVIDGAAAWVCPWTTCLVRYMRVTAEAA
jgi:glycine/D-amino acid oxidase-like deaminating enzyme